MKVNIMKMRPDAVIPTKAHPTDAGFDLTATSIDIDDGNIVFGTGLAFEIPDGYVGLLFPRSSIAKTDLMLTNAVGVIDAHYRGEVMLRFKSTIRSLDLWTLIKLAFTPRRKWQDTILNINNHVCKTYHVGDRVGQLVIIPIPDIELVDSAELSETDRGTDGCGSSGN